MIVNELAEVQEDWEAAVAELVEQWESISADQRAALVAQVRDAIDGGDVEALASLGVDTEDAADELAAAMGDLADQSAGQMAAEAAAQGVKVAAGTVDAAALAAIATAMAGLLGASLAVAAGMEALRLATPGRSADDVAAGVDEHLALLSTAYLVTHLGGALSAAQVRGRFATLEIAPVARWEATEVNDHNQCEPCAEIDGTEYATLDEAWVDYGSGTYLYCEGRWRCRGTIVATWDD